MVNVVLSGNDEDVEMISNHVSSDSGIEVSVIRHNGFLNLYNIKKVLNSDIFHQISAKFSGREGVAWICMFFVLKLMRKKVVLHWIGTDVLTSNRKILKYVLPFVDLHLANAPWLAGELEAMGVKSRSVIIPSPISETSCSPLPKEFTILAYLGWKDRMDFYGKKIVERLIESTSYKFIVLGGEKSSGPPNAEYLGTVDPDCMDEVYSRATVLLRITKHDGLSHMVQESLCRGRYVIWTQEYPFCYHATDYDSVRSYLKKLEDVNEPNFSGVKYFENNLTKEILMKKIVGIYTGSQMGNECVLSKSQRTILSLKSLFGMFNNKVGGTFGFRLTDISPSNIKYVVEMKIRGIDLGYVVSAIPESFPHQNSGGPNGIEKLFSRINIRQTDSIIDIGSGKGGAIMSLHKYPFRKIDGIEIDNKIYEISRSNLSKAPHNNTTVYFGDARTFDKYGEYNFFYIYNPFSGVVMRKVLEKISQSVADSPRNITLVYFNPTQHDVVAESKLFIKYIDLYSYLGINARIYTNDSKFRLKE
jgi:hypothetical protein